MKNYSFIVASKRELVGELKNVRTHPQYHYLAQICSTQSAEVALEISATLREFIDNVEVLGHSTCNYIHDAKILGNDTLVILSEFTDTTTTSTLLKVPEELNEAGENWNLCKNLFLNEDSKAIISFADGIDSKDCELFSSFNSGALTISLAGGISQVNEYGSWVLLNEEIATNALTAIALHGKDLHAWHSGFIEWNPVGRTFEVTQVEGSKVLSLDHRRCSDLYRHYLGDGKMLSLYELKSFPLMRGERINQDICIPENVTGDNIEFSGNLEVGDKVRFCFNHPSLTLEQVQLEAEQLAQDSPDALFVYNCSSRINYAEGEKELLQFEKVAKTVGSYFSGEFCCSGQQKILHHSLTYLALREGESKRDEFKPKINTKRDRVTPLFSLIHNAISDVDSMQKSMEQRLKDQALRLTESYRLDHRTSLPNRIALKEQLSKLKLNEHLVTMKLMNFTQINEKYGYRIGDQLLMDISHYGRKQSKLRFPNKELYSIGIGEWALIIDSNNDAETVQRGFYEFVEQLEQINFRPIGLPEMDHISISVNAGIISAKDYPMLSPDELLIKSIEARRWAKQHNRHVCNAKELQLKVDERQSQLNWLSVVSRAILQNQVRTYAQPIVKSGSHNQYSQECLVRIREGEQIISPGLFLPIIEGTHLYTRLSRQMISNTFDLMRNRSGNFSLNLNPQDLVSEKTICLLEEHILSLDSPERVGLEVLETEEIKDYARVREVCNHLQSLGAKIIIDDFGSGYSNIDEIIKLEPQIIKLDGSLIKNIDKDKKQRDVTKALVNLCSVFGAKTVAEFVHSQEIAMIAEDLGFDYLQGYYFGEPKPL
ncbi:EAL domain-containing protein [Vibrio hannami]|uniref:bifunctional diguanylate cyclase/phosphodiesterase n=1 Tax=Vibrio hannami TaxID=2717094 RepID=UPI00240F0B18|nr:EAL domain-containing protein [Vibrio hannami]MDG3086693.1 EAL domain-containing protein [Vibrio hannami]